MDEGKLVSVVEDSEDYKVLAEERIVIPEGPRRLEEIQPVTERDDDWFMLLDVPSRQTTNVKSGTGKHTVTHTGLQFNRIRIPPLFFCYCSHKRVMVFYIGFVVVKVSLAGGVSKSQEEVFPAVSAVGLGEKRLEIFVEEAEVKEMPRHVKDDWFVLLAVPDRETSFVQPGSTNVSSPFVYF